MRTLALDGSALTYSATIFANLPFEFSNRTQQSQASPTRQEETQARVHPLEGRRALFFGGRNWLLERVQKGDTL
jgi:hypothetical protein